jgi:tetratricopeptide (TPR) repeat protein
VLEQHYDAAQGYQSAGNLTEAARQYRIFIADVLGELAIERAHGGDYDKAAPLFDEALILAPNSPVLEIEYAQAAFAHSDLSHARSLAEQVIRNYPDNAKACAKAHLVLGRTRLCARSRQRKSSLEEKRRDGRRDVRINIERQFPLQETAVPPI